MRDTFSLAGTLTAAVPALALAAVLALAAPAPVAAQGTFQPLVYVNGSAVTVFELQQRERFLTLLNAPPELVTGSRQALIDERLRAQAAAQGDVKVNPEELQAAMEQFASRANMSADQFVTELGKAGVAEQTFRDFLSAQILWRDTVRARFRSQVTVTDRDVDRAAHEIDQPIDMPPGTRVLLSEIIVRRGQDEDARAKTLIDRVATLTKTPAQFAASARQYSSAASRGDSGKLEWMPLENLPPEVRGTVAGLKPGQISAPIHAGPGTWAMFLLHERREEKGLLPEGVEALSYAEYLIPGGRSPQALAEAEKLRARVTSCDDLYAVNKGQPAERLNFATASSASLPADLRAELGRLDAGEASTGLTRGNALVFLMLCSRGKLMDTTTVPRTALKSRLEGEQLTQLAEAWMAELRATAVIREP
ncbi:peptidylprolyl isomerase [Frigidibacter sp. MR17.14]|uniref:peptidylprolyl isomerase n=1 Tax=Frigidibacter sp. MR17.14 TaxID=3126509 RepID=UPI00301317A6